MALMRKLHNGAIQLCASAHVLGKETAPRSRRNIMLSSLVYNVIFNIINGTYLTGFCLAMGADANYVNIIVVIMSICNMFQLVSPLIFERLKQRKKLIILLRTAAHAIHLLVIPLIAMSGLAVETLLVVIGILFSTAQLINALISPGIQVWHRLYSGGKALGLHQPFQRDQLHHHLWQPFPGRHFCGPVDPVAGRTLCPPDTAAGFSNSGGA